MSFSEKYETLLDFFSILEKAEQGAQQIEEHLGIYTTGYHFYDFDSDKDNLKATGGSFQYMFTSYKTLYVLVNYLKQHPVILHNKVLTGIGSGKGRIECTLSSEIPLKKVNAVEIIPLLANIAKQNFNNLTHKANPQTEYNVIATDVTKTFIEETDTYVLFQPFTPKTTQPWLKLLKEKSKKNFFIIYISTPTKDKNIKLFNKTKWLKEYARIPERHIWIYQSDLPLGEINDRK